jgi:NHL repeat.
MKIHFLENKIKLDTTILAKSSEKLPYYPVENIKTSSPKTKWRTDELQAMNEFVTFDLASAKSMEYFQALGSNISDTAWCYVELADDSAFTIGLVSYSLTGEELKTGKFFTSVQKRYLRLKIYGGLCFVGTSGGSYYCYDSCVVAGKIYVCSRDRISIFDAETLEYLSYFGSYGTNDGQFNTPVSICSDGQYLFIADYQNHRIQKFTLDGEFVSKVGSQGSGNDQFNHPHGIRYHDGKVYVSDYKNTRINIRSAIDLSFIENISLTYTPSSCWIDAEKQVILIRSLNAFYIYNLFDYSLVKSKTGLSSGHGCILIDDYIFYSDYNNHKIIRLNYSDLSDAGSYSPGSGSNPGQLNNPFHLNFWSEKNLIMITNRSSPYYVVGITPELKFQSNPDNYIEVGRLIAAEKKSLTRQAITKFDDRYDDKSISIETDALVVFHVTKDLLYRLSIDIEQLKGTDKTLLENFFIDHGLTRAFSLYIEDETEGNYVIPNVRFQSEPTFKYVAYDNFSTSLEVVEVK